MKKFSLQELYQSFQKEQRIKNLTPETFAHYDRAYLMFNQFMIEKKLRNFSHIKQSDWNDFVVWLDNGKRKAVTINTYLRGLRGILFYSMKKHGIPDITPVFMKEQQRVKKRYTEEQLMQLIAEPEHKNFSDTRGWTISCLLLYNCLRAKSIVNLKIEDFDFASKEFSVRHQKNQKTVTFPITEQFGKIIKTYLEKRTSYLKKIRSKDNGFLFIRNNGEQMDRRMLYSYQKYYNKKRGVEKAGLHIFRNTFAWNMIRNGSDAFTLQRWMTHSSINSTKVYVDLYSKDLLNTVEQYNPLVTLMKKQS